MTAKYFLDNHPKPSVEEVRDVLAGNVCRCRAYTKITQAIMAASSQPGPEL